MASANLIGKPPISVPEAAILYWYSHLLIKLIKAQTYTIHVGLEACFPRAIFVNYVL